MGGNARKGPERLGKYRIVGEVGQGGMATVYKAQDEVLGKTVAIKVLRPELTEGEQYLDRFQREARIVASLEHPNIISVFDYGCQDGLYYFVMTYVEGVSVYDLVVRMGRLPVGDAVRVALDLLAALDYAHDRDVIHRDLKPENFMIGRSGATVLTDFGIARPMYGSNLTRVSQRVGTPIYMAPEQVRGGTLDARTDLYAMGLALYEMLTGTVPFQGKDDVEIGRRHVVEAPEPPSRRNPQIGPALESVILTALAKKPEERFPKASAMARALTEAARVEGVVVPDRAVPDEMAGRLTPIVLPPPGEAPVRPGPVRTVDEALGDFERARRRTRTTTAVAAGVAALVVFLLFLVYRSSLSLITVTTIPPGAAVEEGGRLWPGRTPFALRRVGVGDHELVVSKPGWRSARVRVTVTAGELAAVTVALEREEGP